jgi:outer membrane biosynthesis protein TonB
MTNVWTKWEGLVINGVFPLRRFLSRSNHSVVFLTEHRAKNLPDAAIKLVPADSVRAEAQLACWRMDASFSHPHLIRLFDVGRCQLGGHNFIFVVMEFADQTLAQLLAHRALTADETREMLPPALDALAFLHRKRLVQGQLKPPNILVVNDQLKLASDTIRPAGASTVSVAKGSLYDPPEAKDGRMFSAGDVWALGITLVEALTQRDPTWPDENPDTVSLPATLSPAFVDTVRRCLSRNPANRPTIADLEAQFKRTPAEPVAAAAVQQATAAVSVTAAIQRAHADVQGVWSRVPLAQWGIKAGLPIAIATGGLIVLSMVWAGFRLLRSPAVPQSPAPVTSSASATQISLPAPVAAPSAADQHTPAPLAVLHQEIPEASRSARESIRGRISVTIRVVVGRSGNVIHESVDYPGSSRYFARLGFKAAKKWKFAPADSQEPRVWLLRFEFTRSGTTGHAAPQS